MKTIITREINGYNVVMGIDYPITDSVATRLKVDNIVKDDPEMLEAAKIVGQMSKIHEEYCASRKKRRLSGKAQTLLEQFNLLSPKLAALRASTDQKRWNLFVTDPVYFEPKPGEEIVTDDVAKSLNVPRSRYQALLRDGTFIPDFRGVSYWLKTKGKWARNEMTEIGKALPDGYAFEGNLTEDQKIEIGKQFEVERISRLSDNKKVTEIESVKKSALARAAFMKSELEISGDKDPLKKSQSWYKKELKQIDVRYS